MIPIAKRSLKWMKLNTNAQLIINFIREKVVIYTGVMNLGNQMNKKNLKEDAIRVNSKLWK